MYVMAIASIFGLWTLDRIGACAKGRLPTDARNYPAYPLPRQMKIFWSAVTRKSSRLALHRKKSCKTEEPEEDYEKAHTYQRRL